MANLSGVFRIGRDAEIRKTSGGEDVCNLVVVIYRDDGSEVRYAMRVYRAQIDAVTEAEIESFAAKLAQRRYERDIAAYTRVMFSDDDLQYLGDK